MTEKYRKFFKKRIAVLVCLAFISMSFPRVSFAGMQYHSPKVSFLKKCSSFLPAVLSLLNINSPLGMNEYSIMYVFSKADKKPPNETKKDKKKKDSYEDHGNSTSRKPANDRD